MKTCEQYLAEFFLKWEMFQSNIIDKIKTYLMFHNLFPENRAAYETMWKNIIQPHMPNMTI